MYALIEGVQPCSGLNIEKMGKPMGRFAARHDYDNLLHDFKRSLNHVLSGQVLPATCATFDIAVTLALLDIAHAVRSKRPTYDLVNRACREFSRYAAQSGAKRLPDADAAQGQTVEYRAG